MYADHLLDLIDPDHEIFEARLYRNACYLLEKKDDDLFMFIKDISRFANRDLRRSVLLDSRAVSFFMSPKNALPCEAYTAEFDEGNAQKDNYLLQLMDELKELRQMEDVRGYLDKTYQIQAKLKNAKIIWAIQIQNQIQLMGLGFRD